MAVTNTIYNDSLGGGNNEPAADVTWESIVGRPNMANYAEVTDLDSYALKLVPHTQANLTIDFTDGTYIYAEIAANSSFSLSNVPTNQDLYIKLLDNQINK